MNRWNYVKCLVKGISHVEEGSDCQDFVNVTESGGTLVAVLADGLGSLHHSEIASKSVVDFVSKLLHEQFDSVDDSDYFRKILIDNCRYAVQQAAIRSSLRIEDMDCTLLFVAICGDEIKVGQLGDGAICLLTEDSGRLICVPQKGEIANSTISVFSEDAVESIRILRIKNQNNIEAIIITSDGLELELYYPNSMAVKRMAGIYANAVANEKTENATIILHDRIRAVQESGADDDISIVVFAQPNASIKLPDDPDWLCTCGIRNRVDLLRCNNCSADFIDVYSDKDFSYIDKIEYFKSINKTSEEEHYIEMKKGKKKLSGDDKHTNSAKPIPLRDLNKVREEQVMPKHGKTNVQAKNIENKIYKRFSILVCSICFALGAIFAFVLLFYTNRIDYDELARAIAGYQQQEPTDTSLHNGIESSIWFNELNSKLDNIKMLLEQMQLENQSDLIVNISPTDMSIYRVLIDDIIEQYGVNGVMVVGTNGYIANDDGSFYIGQVSQRLAFGKGITLYSDNSILMGWFVNGKKDGIFTQISADGKISTKVYINDKLVMG